MSRRGWVLPLKFHPLRWKYVDDVHICLLYEYYTVGVVRVADGRTLRLRHGVPSWQLFLDPKNLQVEIGWIFTKIELHGDPLGYLQKKEKVWHVRMHPPADCITSNGSIQVLEYSLGELHEQVSFHFVENCWNWSHSESYTPFTWTLPAVAMWPGRQRLGWTI